MAGLACRGGRDPGQGSGSLVPLNSFMINASVPQLVVSVESLAADDAAVAQSFVSIVNVLLEDGVEPEHLADAAGWDALSPAGRKEFCGRDMFGTDPLRDRLGEPDDDFFALHGTDPLTGRVAG
jgi:hypothetical protein